MGHSRWTSGSGAAARWLIVLWLILIKRAVSCWHLHQAISQTTQYLDSWLSGLLQSKLKMNCWKSGGHVPQCPAAGDATGWHHQLPHRVTLTLVTPLYLNVGYIAYHRVQLLCRAGSNTECEGITHYTECDGNSTTRSNRVRRYTDCRRRCLAGGHCARQICHVNTPSNALFHMYRLAFRIVTLSGTFIAAAYELNFVERITIAAVKNINGNLKKNKRASTLHRRNVCFHHCNIHIFVHIWFDLWPLTSDLQTFLAEFPFTWWILAGSFIEITPRHAK